MRAPSLAVAMLVASLLGGACSSLQEPKSARAEPAKPRAEAGGQPKRSARSVASVLSSTGRAAELRLRARFAAAGVAYPPTQVDFLAFKDERQLEVWAGAGGASKRIVVFPLLADSGTLGPKLREGDYQIPEGIYRVVWLHPNSQYHLSMKLDYPNAFDREQAKREGRTNLGGDIFIHGSDVSIGCLAVGDPAIEELFVLAARVGIGNVRVVVAPWDLRSRAAPAVRASQPPWVSGLYAELERTLGAYR